MRDVKRYANVLDAKAATGHSSEVDVRDYRHIILSVYGNATANLTVKVKGCIEYGDGNIPTMSSTIGADNQWDYMNLANLNDKSTITAGDTGIVLSGEICSMYEVNTNGIDWIMLQVSAYTAGAVTIHVALYEE